MEERVLLRQLGKESLLMDKTNNEKDLLVDDDDDEFSLEKEEVAKLVEFKINGHNEDWKDMRLSKLRQHEALIKNSAALMDCRPETRLVQCVVKVSCTVNDEIEEEQEEGEGENKKKKKEKNFYVPPQKLLTTGNSAATKRVAFEDLIRGKDKKNR